MTSQRQHMLATGLMVFSLLVLLGFQFFWLRGAYREQRNVLQQEVDNLYINAMRTRQDSLVQQVVLKYVSRDTFQTERIPLEHRRISSISGERRVEVCSKVDSTSIDLSKFKVFFTTDSIGGVPENHLPGVLSGMVLSLQEADSLALTNLLPELGAATNADDVAGRFGAALRRADIELPFALVPVSAEPIRPFDLETVALPLNFFEEELFQAHLYGVNTYLLRRIAPEFLFSLFMLALTALAFWSLFRNGERQRRLTELKDDLISNITHELKTPITTVGVALEALSHFDGLKDPERTREYIDISRSELGRLSLMVDKVLKTAVFERNELALEPEYFDLLTLVEEIRHVMQPYFEQMGARLLLDSAPGNYELEADRVHLSNVIYNLLDNALKYGGEQPEVTVSLTSTAGSVRLTVADRGIGIPAAYREKIFEKFVRVPAGDEHNARGYGLGLSYVGGIVRRHGGRVAVESEEGRGSRFTIFLPRKYETDQSTLR